MSTTLTPEPPPTRDGADRDRSKLAQRIGITALVLVLGGLVIGGFVIFAWMVDETHFDRPSAEFDAFAAEVEALPGVDTVDTEQWVEAPTFSHPTSWMFVTADEAALPGVIEAACSTAYTDPVTWSITVNTPAGAQVSLHSPATNPQDTQCPDFGFDAEAVGAALDRIAPGLVIQPSIWDNGRFALVALEDHRQIGYAHLLPLVENSDELLAAAGLEAGDVVEINSGNLGFLLEPGESAAYVALLTELADEHGVTSYWADGGTPIDGIEKVQLVAPAANHAAIEAAIRSSGLHIADLPVRFLEQ